MPVSKKHVSGQVLFVSRRLALILGFAIACLCLPQSAWAIYTVLYNGTQVQISGVSNPSGLALDLAGNLYIADTGNHRILKVPAGSTTPVLFPITIGGTVVTFSGSSPSQMTVDSAGNLYITDPTNNRIIQSDPSGNGISLSPTVSTGNPSMSGPEGVAVDTFGDIFIADTGNSRIIEIPAGGSAVVLSTVSGVPLTSLNTPKGLATDTSDNLYIVDSGNFRLVKLNPSLAGSVISFSPSLSKPVAVAVQNNGTVYVVDDEPSPNARIAVHDPQGNLYDLFFDEINNSFGQPTAIAIDSKGSFYLTDSSAVNLFHQGSADFGHTRVGSTATPITLNFKIGFDTVLTGVAIYTAGTQNLDFTLAANSGLDCSSSAVNASPSTHPITCTVNVQFTPMAAGLRRGALVLSYYNGDFAPQAAGNFTVPLFGIGDAPVAALSPATASQVSTGSLSFANPFKPFQTAYDGSGNMYATDTANNRVLKIPFGGGSATVVNIPSLPSPSGLNGPTGLAIDGAGNLFISDSGNNRIVEVTLAGTSNVLSNCLINTVFPCMTYSFNNPQSLFIDGSGNLIVDDAGNNRIVQLTLALSNDNTLANTFAYPLATGTFTMGANSSSAMDTAGALYISDDTNNRVIKVDRLGSSSLVNFSTPLSAPHSVTLDPFGNLYVMDAGGTAGSARILKKLTNGTTSTMSIGGIAFGSAPNQIAVDNRGNVLVADYTPSNSVGRLTQVNVGMSQQAFTTSILQGSTSAQPLTTTVTNIGIGSSSPLIFSSNPTYTANFSQDSSDANPCTSDTTLSIGQNCDVSINFTPQSAGNLSANIIVTDNTQNIAAANQLIQVTGTATPAGDATTVTQTSPSLSTYSYGQPITISVQVANTAHPGTIPTGTVTFTDAFTSTITQKTLDANGIATLLSNAVLSGIGTHTITAAYGGVSGSFLGNNTDISVTINKASTTLTGPSSLVLTTIGQSGSTDVVVTPASTGGAMPSGSINYAIMSASNIAVASGSSVLAVGSVNAIATVPIPSALVAGLYTINVSYAGDGNYQSATSISFGLTVKRITPTITWAPASSITYGTNLTTILSATASNGSSIPGTFAYAATPSNGSASVITNATVLGAGSYILMASFTPTDTTTYASTVSTVALTVNKATPGVSWTPSASSIAYGTTLGGILNATASFNSSSVAGTFAYTTMLTGGRASSITNATVLTVGSYTLTATFTPTDATNYASASSTATLTVGKAIPASSVVSSLNPSIFASPVVFTATVTSTAGTPTGTVAFYDGTTLLNTVTISGGTSVYSTSSLATGTHSITAVYSGDSNFAPVTSSAVAELIQDFTISTSPSSGGGGTPSQTAIPGGTATYTLNIGPSAGTVFPAPVTLSLSGLPPGATGTLSPTTLPAGSSLSSVTLTIQLPQAAKAEALPSPWRSAPLALALLLLPFARKLRRAGKKIGAGLSLLAVFAVTASALAGLTGCNAKNGFFSQAPQTYTVTITATCGSLSHSTNVTLTVE